MCAVAEDVKRLIPKSKLTIIENGPIDLNRVLAQRVCSGNSWFLEHHKRYSIVD